MADCKQAFGLLEKERLTSQEISNLNFAINTFTTQMVDAWGQTHITHYMVGITLSLYNDFACELGLKIFHICLQHILLAHGAIFLDKYSSMGIWSSQGMECSHYEEKVVNFKNTRHGGK